MNPLSSNASRKQDQMARKHRENILYALSILKEASSGEIKSFTDAMVESEVQYKFSSSKYLTENQQQVAIQKQTELTQKKMTQRSIQKWLIRLERDHLISRNRYHVYRLTVKGREEKILGEFYGKEMFDNLARIPLKGTQDQKIRECVNRFGIYVVYIFNWVSHLPKELEQNDLEWITEAINPQRLFEWFSNEFYSKPQKDDARSKTYKELVKILNRRFSKYYENLTKTEMDHYTKHLPDFLEKYLEEHKLREGEQR